jgi:acetylornithine deacetylase
VLKGVGGGKSLILNGHSDVVSPNGQKWIHGPWSAKIENGKMYGRGVCDMKAGLTSIIMALECIQEAGLEPLGDVIIESVVGEETGGNGTLACIMKGYKADAGIVAEPTNMEIHVAQAGALWFKVTCWGKAAHGAFRQEGVSALEKAIKIHDALLGLEARRLKMVHHKLFEEKYEILPIAINIGILHAGKWFTAVPDEAVFEGRIGLLPGENYKEIEDVFEGVIKEVAVKDDWMKKHPPKVEWLGKWEPAEISIKHPIVDVLSSAYYELAYRKATISGTPGGTDMRLLTIYGETPSLLFGPGSISQCHTVDEFVDVEDLIAATKVIAYAITKWCGVKQF